MGVQVGGQSASQRRAKKRVRDKCEGGMRWSRREAECGRVTGSSGAIYTTYLRPRLRGHLLAKWGSRGAGTGAGMMGGKRMRRDRVRVMEW